MTTLKNNNHRNTTWKMAELYHVVLLSLLITMAFGRVTVEDSYPTIIAERPYRPIKSNWEKFFFDSVETLVDTVEGLPQTPLDIFPFPSLTRFRSAEESESTSEAPAIIRDHYDIPQKILIPDMEDKE